MEEQYNSILDGCNLTNDDDASDPSYFGYTRPGGSWVILKFTDSSGLYVYALGRDTDLSLSTYDTAWTNRATIGYTRPGNLKKL